MKTPKLNKKAISGFIRFLLFIVGIILLSACLLFASSWGSLPISISMLGVQINEWIVASILVIIGIIGSGMVKVAITGSKEYV